MSKRLNFNAALLSELIGQYRNDDHFLNIVMPRLRLLFAIKEEMNHDLIWTLNYSPTNKMENCVNISLPDERKKFHLFYSIPLSIRLCVHLYLGDNTFNFFEAHPLLLKHQVIKEEEYKIEATINTLPHLVLTNRNDKYDQLLLSQTEYDSGEIRRSKVYTILEDAFNKFNPLLKQLINGELTL